jgi:hypothetical protein
MLVSVKQAGASADEATSDKLSKEYQAWLQSTAVADAKAEIEGLQVGVEGSNELVQAVGWFVDGVKG